MEPFRQLTGIAVPVDRANIDTDAIIPKQFLKRIERSGFGQFLFYDWRFTPTGEPNPEFVLNRAPYDRGTVLIGGPNFGCGSSREHAPWALLDYGFRSVIAPSFADIFYNNCFQNGILPVTLAEDAVQTLMHQAVTSPGATLTVDLTAETVTGPDGAVYPFSVNPYRKACLLDGLDDIGLTLRHEEAIAAYEQTAPYAAPIHSA